MKSYNPYLYFITIVLLINAKYVFTNNIIIKLTDLGILKGTTNITLWSQRTIYQFQGIPFAKPPSGERRFKEPEPAEPWLGELDSTQFKRKCPQAITSEELQDLEARSRREDVEDCLYLNVYTNQVPGKCKIQMAVMFYIHGGSFRVGSAQDFRPNYLLEQDVVLVVIQYRLGPLGFLSLQDDSIAGNMGLLDQLLALKWVNKHIAKFCGDPNKVTIFGQSSGAAAVSLMMVSPLVTKDLFQRAIIQSGSGLCDWAFDYNPVDNAKSIAKRLNCTSSNIKEIADCLRKTSPYDIISAHSAFLGEVIMKEGRAVKGANGGNHAVIQTAGKNKFLIEDPKFSYEIGNFHKMPTMVGITKHEGTFFLGNIYDYILERKTPDNKRSNFDEMFTEVTLKFSGIDDTTGAINDVFKDKFFNENELGNFTAMTPGLVDICGVTLLKACILKQARKNRKYDRTYLYTMNYHGHLTKFGYGEEVNYPFPGGVAHSDDLIYLFPFSKGNLTEAEKVVAKTMVEMWTNFAIYGKPTPATGVTEWPTMTSSFGPYLRIDAHNSIRDNFIDEYTITIKEGLVEYNPNIVINNSTRNNSNNIYNFNFSLLLSILTGILFLMYLL